MDDVIAKALERLPERRRDVILLSYFLEFSDREIGYNLGHLRWIVAIAFHPDQRSSTTVEQYQESPDC
jgi:NADH/NAD ratio-sensing transcriptional regulator Rex